MHAYPMRAEVDIKFGMILVGVVDSLTGTYCQIVKHMGHGWGCESDST